VFCGALVAMGSAFASEVEKQSPQEWLRQMQQAVEGINYEGTLVHMRPGRVEQFRVLQRVHTQGVTERLVLMDGMGAEIIRTPDEVICIFPEHRSVVVENRQDARASAGPLRASLPSVEDLAPAYYGLSMGPDDRVAERRALTIGIKPKDQYRYGYRLWLDKETAMPLKSQLVVAESDVPIEEIRFVAISLPEEISAAAVEPGIDTSDFEVTRHKKSATGRDITGAAITWRADDLPPGFMLTVSRFEFMDGSDEPRMHLVYTDGLASVSVFLDRVGEHAQKQAQKEEGASMMGAANAYTLMKEGLLVTAMGEVPARTVERIAVSMKPAAAR